MSVVQMSDKEMAARLVNRLHRLTLSGDVDWEPRDPKTELDLLNSEAPAVTTSSVYYADIGELRLRIYRRRRFRSAESWDWTREPPVLVDNVMEFVNPDGFSDGEYSNLPGLPHLFDLVRRKTSRLDQKLAAIVKRDENVERSRE